MGSTQVEAAEAESVESRFAFTYEVLRDRTRLTGALKATMAARFLHYAVAFILFFVIIVAPETLLQVELFDFREWLGRRPVAAALIGGFLLVDYVGFLLARGLRYSMLRQLHDGTDVVGDWRDHLGQSLSVLPRMLLVDLLLVVAALVGVAMLVLPAVAVLLAAGPVRHYIVDRGVGIVDGVRSGVRMTRRYARRLGWRLFVRVARRLGALAVLGGTVVGVGRFAPQYLRQVLIGVGVVVGIYFLVVRPFVLYFATVDEVAFLSTLGQREGELELTEE
jgi:hypothetical protein